MGKSNSHSADQSWRKVKLPVRIAASAAFVLWLFVIVSGGFAWPSGLMQFSHWPWNQSWFMFYRSSGKHYFMQAKGTLADGSSAPPLIDRYFKFPAAFHSSRFNEVTRDDWHVRQMAAYLCRKYNREAPYAARMATISVWDTWWDDKRGVRRYESEIPAAEKQTWNYLTNEPCSKLEMEVPQ